MICKNGQKEPKSLLREYPRTLRLTSLEVYATEIEKMTVFSDFLRFFKNNFRKILQKSLKIIKIN